jgi:hypothetical protein
MIFNIIAYRPNGYLNGDRSDSYLHTFNTTDLQEAVEFIAKITFSDKWTDREYSSHEFIVIVDGRVIRNEIDNDWCLPDDTESYYDFYYNNMLDEISKQVTQYGQDKVKKDAKTAQIKVDIAIQQKASEEAKHREYIKNEFAKLNPPVDLS